GYTPQSLNVPTARLPTGGLVRNFELTPATQRVVTVEAIPDVHHLGNDRFDGEINSQFQKHSEGDSFEAPFELSASQLAGVESAELVLMAKGVQCPHKIRINGELLARRMRRSPADGSFGEMTLPFDASVLHEGSNTIQITTS